MTTDSNVATQEEIDKANEAALKTTMEHPVFGKILTALRSLSADYSERNGKLVAASAENQEAAVKAWTESTTDVAAVKLRDQITKLTEQLNAMGTKAVASESLSEDDKAKLKVEVDKLRVKFREGWAAATTLAPTMGVPDDQITGALKAIGDPTRGSKGRPAGSSGSSGPRASVNVWVKGGTGENAVDQNYENLAVASKASGVELSKIQAAYAAAGEVEVANISKIKTPQKFEVDGWSFSTTPKTRKNAAK